MENKCNKVTSYFAFLNKLTGKQILMFLVIFLIVTSVVIIIGLSEVAFLARTNADSLVKIIEAVKG